MENQQQASKPTKPTKPRPENAETHKAESLPAVVPQHLAVVPSGPAPGSTLGISELCLTQKQTEALMREPDVETEVEIRPDGVVYMPAICIRKRLDEAFGPGNWAIRQERSFTYDPATREVVYDGSLWVNGKYVSRAVGGCRWWPENRQMSKSDALEGAKSDCLRRCAKDIGIGHELWTPAWIRDFIADYAMPYEAQVKSFDPRDNSFKTKLQWRKKGVSLSGDILNTASGIAGEFPLGFNPDTLVQDGPHVGKPLRDIPDDAVVAIASNAKTKEWKLAAKAEIVRRANSGVSPGTIDDDAEGAVDAVFEVKREKP